MNTLLAGDIGGTKTVLTLSDAVQSPDNAIVSVTNYYEKRYSSSAFFDLVPIVETFLAEATQQLGKALKPQKACFAIAGPVVNNTSQLTNLSWSLDAKRLQQNLGLDQVALINDFEAVGHGVLGLHPEHLVTLQVGEPKPDAPIAVIGAGTGLGQGFVIRTGDSYRVFPTEGGHTDFSPRNDLEFQLLNYLQGHYALDRVSVERVVSGQGIVAIYQFLRDSMGPDYALTHADNPVAQVVRAWECHVSDRNHLADPAAAIASAAQQQNDFLSQKTMQVFLEAYGAEAGNLALKLLPYGGLYIAGGVAAKNLDLMQSGHFMNAFCHKGRMRSLMERIPVHIVRHPNVGLLGAVLKANQL
jgi:glucokinase